MSWRDRIGARILRAGRTRDPSAVEHILRLLLSVPAALYGAVACARNFGYNKGLASVHRLPCRVVSVGNLTAGGTGKTPMTIALARAAQSAGGRPAVLLRGYRGAGAGSRVVSDGDRVFLDWRDAGDESILLARSLPGVPVVVGGDRVASGRLAVKRFRPDLFLLDDGFQHRRLHRDRDLVLLDGTDLFGGARMLPRGRLREPTVGLRRSHAAVITRADQADNPAALCREVEAVAPGLAVGLAAYRATGVRDLTGAEQPTESLSGRRVLALSGIANPQSFQRTLVGTGAVVVGVLEYPDHHPFTEEDLVSARQALQACGAEWIVTTEKDAVRLNGRVPKHMPMFALCVALDLTAGAEAVSAALGIPIGANG